MNNIPSTESKKSEPDHELSLTAFENCINEAKEPRIFPQKKRKFEPDDEFLLKTYEDLINEAEEWDGSSHAVYYRGSKKYTPLLIRECDRLIPMRNKKTGYVDFHPFNMPEVELKNVNLMGMVMKSTQHKNLLEVEIYDGTGIMNILYNTNQPNRYFEFADKQGFPAKLRSLFALRGYKFPKKVKRDKLDLKLTSESLEMGDYVSVFGFCNLSIRDSRNVNDDNFWRNGKMPTLLFRAFEINRITEAEYITSMEFWLKHIIKPKYAAV